MAIYRVTDRPNYVYSWWPNSANNCFYCTKPLVAGELAVTWMSIGGYSYWHVDCAKDWGAAFMRDVWEITKAAAKHPVDPDPYGSNDEGEPNSRSTQ
jgi:hypothetical protein